VTSSKRIWGLLAAVVLLFAACGDDGGGDDGGDESSAGGNQEAFCERLEELVDDEALDVDGDAAVAAFEELEGLAPAEIAPSLEAMHEAFAALGDLDEDDPDDVDAALELLYDEELLDATERFGEYAEEECGVEGAGGDLEDLDDLTADLPDELTVEPPDDLSDEPEDDDPSVSSRLRDFLDAEDAELADLIEGIGSVDIAEDEAQVTLTVGDDPADVETGVAICELALAFADQEGFAAFEVEVENDDDTQLAEGDLDDGCEAA
jgi:hypothetical protein